MTDASTFAAIAARLPELDDAQQAATGLRSPRITSGGGGDTTDRLPFGLGQVLGAEDDPRSVGNILAWSASWALTIADLRGERVHATALAYLAHTADWAAREYGDWDSLAEEADAILARLDRLTGHTPQTEPLVRCPSCGGTLERDATDHGLSDVMACASCGETYADDGHANAVRRVKIKTSQAEDVWITREDVATLWPNLDRRTLHAWVQRGHVTRDTSGRYLLADLTTRTRRLAA